ncbi:MAG: TolC family protein [Kofleriaceae bacterium]|nr:TolC family protein [Kofleriaceae bacterium]
MRSLLALACVPLIACVPRGPTKTARPIALPAAFSDGLPGASVAALDWRTFFADEALNRLIGEALANNYDLQIALQRIEIARAQTTRTAGARLPQIDMAVAASLRRFGAYTMDGAGNASTDIRPGQRVPEHYPEVFAGLQATWEADLWGRLGKLHGAARARYLASIEGTHLVIAGLVAEVARTYYELLAVDAMVEITAQSAEQQARALELMRVEMQAGRTTALAVQQFAAQVATTRALAASLAHQQRGLENQLTTLVGRLPSTIARTDAALERDVPRSLASGVPSDLLRNRPDIRAAELAVQASRYDVGAARAAFYPRLRITASLGYEAFDPRFLFATPESLAYGVLGGLVAPLVNRSAIKAELAVANATQLEAMVRYQQTVLRSFAEVSTTLFRLGQLGDVVRQQREKLAAVRETVATAEALFRAGRATYFEVLLAQQNTLQSRLELVGALRDRHITRIQLYRALGGGWQGTLAVRP